MPELPEVERARRLVERVAVGRTIASVQCDDDRIVFAGVTPARVAKHLTGRTVVGSHRRGKQMWWSLDKRPWPLFHFAMTGQFVTPQDAPLRIAATGNKALDRSWPPKFCKILVRFDDGGQLAMTNSRRFGRIRLQHDPPAEEPIARMGFDPLYEMPAAGEFIERLRGRKAVLKSLLLDQRFIAGVGNWMADEILYQAKIDPKRRASELTTAEAKRIYTKTRSIVELACRVEADKSRFPRGWLFHHRWGKNDDARTHKGEAIEHMEIGGRTTAWVPAVQK